MAARKPDLITAEVATMTVASNVASLAANLAKSQNDRTGVYADGARHDLEDIRASLALIEQVVSGLPVMKREEVA